jgi:hypothetical protein
MSGFRNSTLRWLRTISYGSPRGLTTFGQLFGICGQSCGTGLVERRITLTREFSTLSRCLLARLVLPANTSCGRITKPSGRSSSIYGRQPLTKIPRSLAIPLKKTALLTCLSLVIGARAVEAQVITPNAPPPGAVPTYTFSGLVRAEATGFPLPYTAVLVEPLGRERFTDQGGWFRHFAVPAGKYKVRLRQLGYIPVDTTITISSNFDYAFFLVKVPSTLAEVQVTAPPRRCIVPEENGYVDDPDLTTVLGEARKNAERERLLRRTYPFEYKLAQAHDTYNVETRTHRVVYDTITFRSDDDWRYRKGRVVSEDQNKLFGTVRVMRLPTLTDLADVRFLTAHCFKYSGLSEEDSIPTHRIDFAPLPEIKAPDVEGSIFIDSATYLIRRAEFRLTRGGSIKPAVLGMKVTTTYREILPNVALFDEIESVQPLSIETPGGHRSEFRQKQRLLTYRFLFNGPPGTDAPMTWRTPGKAAQTSDVSK